MVIDKIKQGIENGLPGAIANVDGDGVHFQTIVVYDGFAGRSTVQRHRMIYQSLGDKVGTEIHALSIETYTTEEWARKKQRKVP